MEGGEAISEVVEKWSSDLARTGGARSMRVGGIGSLRIGQIRSVAAGQ